MDLLSASAWGVVPSQVERPFVACRDGLLGVTGHAVALEVLGDARRFSSRFGTGPGRVAVEGRSLNLDDPPRSTALRRELQRVVRVPSGIEALADQLLAPLIKRGSAELVSEFAQPLSLAVFGEVFGLMHADELRELATLTRALPRAANAADFHRANEALLAWLRAKAHEVRGGAFFELGGELEAMDQLFLRRLLAQTGFESTAMAIALSIEAVLEAGAELDASERAAEELLRFVSPLVRFVREVTEPSALAGRQLEVGQRLAVFFPLVNRDPAVFADPERLDLSRQRNPHLAFGHGPHVCVGRALATEQVRAAMGALSRAGRPGVTRVERLQSSVTRGLEALHVSWPT